MKDKEVIKIDKLLEIIRSFENPYPKDIFSWENKDHITISRGRFNQFINSVVENTKNGIIKNIIEEVEV